MKILVVDDTEALRREVRDLLAQSGFNDVEEANDGLSALQKLQGAGYGLVISDWHLGSMTGPQLCRHIRADDRLTRTPFLLISPDDQSEQHEFAQDAWVDGIVSKPIDAAQLKRAVEAAAVR